MTDAEKVARALVDGLRLHPGVTLSDAEADEAVRLTAAGFVAALRDARNEGLEEGAKWCEGFRAGTNRGEINVSAVVAGLRSMKVRDNG